MLCARVGLGGLVERDERDGDHHDGDGDARQPHRQEHRRQHEAQQKATGTRA